MVHVALDMDGELLRAATSRYPGIACRRCAARNGIAAATVGLGCLSGLGRRYDSDGCELYKYSSDGKPLIVLELLLFNVHVYLHKRDLGTFVKIE